MSSPDAWPSPYSVEDQTEQEYRAPRPEWTGRFRRCEPYRDAIESSVRAYWGPFQEPDAWAAQIYQESLCDPSAVSPAGARGIAQFMPGTWAEVAGQLDLPPGSTPHQDIAIDAGAFYQARMMSIWIWDRPLRERWRLGLASYNAGAGNILRAQRACDNARYWSEIETCLPQITGHHSVETRTYVRRIERWEAEMSQSYDR